MDAWEDHSQNPTPSPEQKKYVNKMLQKLENKNFRLKKVEVMADRSEPNQ